MTKIAKHTAVAGRLRELLDLHPGAPKGRGDKAWFAREVKVSSTQTNNWLLGYSEPGRDALERVAALFGTTIDYILKGDQTLSHGNQRQTHNSLQSRSIPVLSYTQAVKRGEHVEGGALMSVWADVATAEEWSAAAFAVVIEDMSMAPGLMPGDTVIIDPGMPVHPGDYVLARAGALAVFRECRFRGASRELAALNVVFDTYRIDSPADGEIIGPVVERRSRTILRSRRITATE